MNKLIVASNNAGKLKEIKEILSDSFEVISMSEVGIFQSPEETGDTFSENAIIKAKTLYDATGFAVISDDSGLCVKALDGAPGVYSARYAGDECDDEKNNKLLLKNLAGISDRRAEFVSCVCFYCGHNACLTAYGRVQGEILNTEHGNGGFGYDPLFYSYDLKKSFGEATAQEKNSVSHRARALDALMRMLKDKAYV